MMIETGNFILTAISTVGFPIVMCVAMFWYLNEERKTHEKETAGLRESLDANTNAITQLKDLLDFLRSGGMKNDFKRN